MLKPRLIRKIGLLFLACLPLINLAQQAGGAKKYPTLLWEITGKGLQRPSYLFGTMHVSDKMVFNLDDSFYTALKSVGTIALELDPGIWQQHYSKEDNQQPIFSPAIFGNGGRGSEGSLSMTHFSIDPYVEDIARALNIQPTNMNAFLYRNSSNSRIDFEENTYLDLHLYQTAMKLGKRIAGLENIDTSDYIEEKARKAARKDRNRPRYDFEGIPNLGKALQDAYRKGDLDLLDSLQDISSLPSYRKIFLFDRNVIQANSIDTILKKGENVFAAVGAAHLPGPFGVIEELRKMGYRLRPMMMLPTNSAEKERIDKLVAPVAFTNTYTPDSLIKVALPGPWYRMGRSRLWQHADMANGSYYTLYRQRTSAAFWNESPATVIKKVDSLLYEKIAGKIVQKTKIVVNGYPGIDVSTLTRRGDAQRYHIVATPVELIILKMSGPADYLQRTTDADRFFNSLEIKPLEHIGLTTAWQPSWGGFSLAFPHQPWEGVKTSSKGKLIPFEFTAIDSTNKTSYNLLREVLPRNGYLEEDTFELNLMQESYMGSKMVQKELGRRFTKVQGYPALEASFKLEDGGYSQALFVIQGANYYSLVAQRPTAFKTTDPVLASFAIRPFVYPAPRPDTNKLAGYAVNSPVPLPDGQKGKEGWEDMLGGETDANDDMATALEILQGISQTLLRNDTIGEQIDINCIRLPEYTYLKDSSFLQKNLPTGPLAKNLTLKRKTVEDLNGWNVTDRLYTAANSSRSLHYKHFYKNGMLFTLSHYSDTLSQPSAFTQNIFSSFTPADTLQGIDPFVPKSNLFVRDFTSGDTVRRKNALRALGSLEFTKEELPLLRQVADTLGWKSKDYLGLKQKLFAAAGTIKDTAATHWLKDQYGKIQDTVVLQQAVLEALLEQESLAAYKAFEELVTGNPPIGGEEENKYGRSMDLRNFLRSLGGDGMTELMESRRPSQGLWGQLYDSLSLTAQIMPGLLNLLVLEDYKKEIESLMLELADSNYLTKEMMQPYYTRYLLETKQELKKILARQSAASIEKKAKEAQGEEELQDISFFNNGHNRTNNGSLLEKLPLLLPFYQTQQPVQDLVRQAFSIEDKDTKLYLTMLLQKKLPSAIPDTMNLFLAKDTDTRARLYNQLVADSLLASFPKEYATPQLIAESRLHNLLEQKPDTFVLAGKIPATIQDKKGEIFVYKYRHKPKSSLWRWAVVGMIPGDTLLTNRDAFDVELADAGLVKAGKPEKEEVRRLAKEVLNALRPCAKSFYRQNNRYSNSFRGIRFDD